MKKKTQKKHISPEKYLNQLLKKNQKTLLKSKDAGKEVELLYGMAASCMDIENDLMLLKDRMNIIKEDFVYKKNELSDQIDRVMKRLKRVEKENGKTKKSGAFSIKAVKKTVLKN